MNGPPVRRLALVAAGYAIAWMAGSLAVWLHDRGLSAADQQAMSGMLAFGDTVLFWAVAAPLAIVPTVFLFSLLRSGPRFWRVHAIGSVLLSLTGLVEAVLFLIPVRPTGGMLAGLHDLAPIRILAAPVFLLLYSPGLVRAAGPNRKITLTACLFEVCAFASFAVWLLLQYRASLAP